MPPRRPSKRMPTITEPAKIGELLRAIDTHAGTFIVGCALKLSAMWACRPGEIRQSEWANVDLDSEHPTLTIPPSIRKLRRVQKEDPDTSPHIVPLSTQAVAILRELHALTGRGKYLFPGARDPKRPMSEAAVTAALARLGYKGAIVAHGFRHMASTLLNEHGWKPDAIERQLSHKDKDKIRGTYNLAQYMDERRRMMQSLADYLDTLKIGGNVLPMTRKAG
jgi:integrase